MPDGRQCGERVVTAVADNPHLARPLVHAGARLATARRAAVLVHGRDQDATVMLDVARRLGLDDVAYLLPEADGRSWYAGRYYDPVATLQAELDRGLAAIERALDAARVAGHPDAQIVVGGFSQGACLVAELVARGPSRPYAGAAILTGSLVGPPAQRRVNDVAPGLPMVFACSRHDDWVAIEDARDTARRFDEAGATTRFLHLEDRVHHVADAAVSLLRDLLTAD